MTEAEKRKASGAKMSRSETVSVRLDPKLRYMAELASRKQRRTLSSYIEWAVAVSLKSVNLYDGSGYNGDESVTVEEMADRLWDVDESERFIKLAISYPSLLTHEEQELWKMLGDSNLLAPARHRSNGAIYWDNAAIEDVVCPEMRRLWLDLLAAHAQGQTAQAKWVAETRSEVAAGAVYLNYPPKVRPVAKTDSIDIDDDIPF